MFFFDFCLLGLSSSSSFGAKNFGQEHTFQKMWESLKYEYTGNPFYVNASIRIFGYSNCCSIIIGSVNNPRDDVFEDPILLKVILTVPSYRLKKMSSDD